MPTSDKPPMTRAVVLRGIGFAAAIALGAVAAWLVVTGDDQRTLRIGMLVGLWGLVLGAYSMFGARRGMGVEASDDPGRQIALREARQLERQDDANARRDWESRLERLISREVSTAIGRETAALRNEIAHLRQELLDKVGGQLRLERIETTRLIGSDLEALQHEVRQLKDANEQPAAPGVRELLAVSNDPRLSVRPVVEAARVRPVTRSTAEVERDVRPAVADTAETAALRDGQPAPAPASAGPSASAGQPASAASAGPSAPPVPAGPSGPSASAAPVGQPAPTPPPAPRATPASSEPTPSAPSGTAPVTPPEAGHDDAVARVHRPPTGGPAPAPVSQPGSGADPFAGLPRLSRFTDFVPEQPSSNGNGNSNKNGNGHHADAPEYRGRRRRADDSADDATTPEPAEPEPAHSGHRRRHDDSDDANTDLLARLLSRESHGH